MALPSNLPTKQNRDLPTINERIRFPKIRVIDSDGSQLGIMVPRDALRMAEEKELDLVRFVPMLNGLVK